LEYAFISAGFLGRIQTLLRLKKYTDEQAKSEVFRLARSIDSKKNLRNGHSDRLVACAQKLGESLGLVKKTCRNFALRVGSMMWAKLTCQKGFFLNPGLWTRTKEGLCKSIR